MSKEIVKILERISDSASIFGLDEGELASFIVVAKFNTELGNAVLANTMNTLFVRMQREDTLDVLEEVGIKDMEGKDFYELLDALVDTYPSLSEENKAKIIEALGGAMTTNLVLSCFGKINL
jgi:hypothetical protein